MGWAEVWGLVPWPSVSADGSLSVPGEATGRIVTGAGGLTLTLMGEESTGHEDGGVLFGEAPGEAFVCASSRGTWVDSKTAANPIFTNERVKCFINSPLRWKALP